MKPSDLYVVVLALTIAACGGGDTGPEGGRDPEPDPVDRTTPAAKYLPKVFGTCPKFAGNGAIVTFQTERGDRSVLMWMSAAAETLDGPLIFYWHGWHGTPAYNGMSWEALQEVLDMGGIYVVPLIDPEAAAARDDYWSDWELITADQVVACAIATVGIDKRRIHSIGFSAGGMQTYRMIHERSGYLASAILYSPGANPGPGPRQETENKIPSLITWGSAEVPIHKTLAELYFDTLTGYGFFSMMCNHRDGHLIPSPVRDRALDFLLAHPFGTDPSPFASGIPSDFPSYCSLTR